MTTTLEVIYEDGIFKPLSSVPESFKEHERMKIIVETEIKPKLSQAEFDQMLFDEGLLVNFPIETDENEDFEPIKFEGKPISETIIEERR
ncbi:MAG: antitoxin family protein [Blastocatellia bacterium]|nr:antitoxin family protein [Blastocatellia bacterium]